MEFLSKEGLRHLWQQILGKLNGYVAKGELDRYAEKDELDSYATKNELDSYVEKNELNSYATKSELDSYAEKDDLNNYVAKEDGKGLSSEDYTPEEKTKLASIASNAEVNQNAFGVIKTKSGSVNATINADTKVDTITFEAGDNITLITNESTGVVKIIGADAPEAPEASLEALGISATATELNRVAGVTSNIQEQLNERLKLAGTGVTIASGTDLNTLTTPNTYICIASYTPSLINCPVSSNGFKLLVMDGYSEDRKHQFLLRGASSDFYYRMYDSTNKIWTNWVNFNTKLSDLGITATAAELNKLDGLTATTAELNILDGVTATAAELNYVDGVTSNIQTQLNAKVPTSRTVNGKALSSNITLSAGDVGAAEESHNHSASEITSGTLAAARIPNISIDKLVAGSTNATIPTSLLPAYVDDVLEYTAKSNFPTTGESGKIYVDKTTNLTWRWSGSAYVEISPSLALGSTSSTAHRGDHGAAAYTHSQSAHAPSNAQKNSDITKAEIEAKLTGAITSHTHDYVPTSRTVNGKALSANLTLSASDVGAVSEDDINNYFNITSSGSAIAANTDLNTLTTPGNYSCVSGNVSSLTNCPITEGGFKLVVINGYTTEYKHQFIYWGAHSYIYYRTRNSNGTWKNWALLNNVSLANAEGTLPISKGGTDATTAAEALTKLGAAPATHSHNASDINAGTLNAARLPNISIDKLVAGTTNATIPSSLLPAYIENLSDLGITATAAELNYIDGVTSNIQTQLDGKAPDSHTHSDYLNITAAGSTIAKNTDLNTITTPGHYSCISGNNSGLSNCPLSSGGFKLIVIQGYSTGYISQFIMAGASHKYFYRSCNSNGTWYAWVDFTDKAPAEHAHDYVPTSRTINDKALSSNITLSASDVSAVPISRTINGKALSSNITLSASDVSARSNTWVPALTDCSGTLSVAKGGTGATTAAEALTNLGAAPATHTHPEYYNINSVGTAIAENADLNTYTTPGVYYALAATAAKLSNSPTSSGFRLVVERGYSTGRYIQRVIGGSTANAEWVRYYSGSAWGVWQRTVRADSASSAYPTYLQAYSSYAATLGFGCSDSGMWLRAFRDGEYGEYLHMTKDGKNVYTYTRGTTDTKVSTLYGTANIHYGSSTPTGAYTGQLWFKPV